MERDENKFTLSINNINDINYDRYDKNFTFFVNGKRYSTTRIVADLLSPKIRKLHFIDETINEFHIETSNKNDDSFSDFLQLCNFKTTQLDDERRERYSTYFLKIGNINEYFKLQKPINDSLTIEESLKYIENQEQLFSSKSEEIYFENTNNQEIISFICQHFYDITVEDLLKLRCETVYEIISNSSLVIKDEDWLLDIIIKLYEKDQRYSNLFSTILFFNLKYESLEKFINTFSIEYMNQEIWQPICNCILKLKQPDSKPDENLHKSRYLKRFQEFKIEQGSEFKGIMHYLTNKSGGNIHDKGIVDITSNSVRGDSYHPKNSVDYESDRFYASVNNSTLAYICFDFKDNRIQLSNYSIKSANTGKNRENLRSWVVEASNDGKNYEELDSHSDDQTLNGANNIGIFKISKVNDKFYRYIRLRQTNKSWYYYSNSYRYQYYIQFIEFFGKLEN